MEKVYERCCGIYEDMVNEKLSEARFQMLSDDYEREQAELRVKIDQLTKEIAEQEDQAENVDRFIRQVKKYLYLYIDILPVSLLQSIQNSKTT